MSESKKIKELQAKLKKLEKLNEQKQMEIEFKEKMIEIPKESAEKKMLFSPYRSWMPDERSRFWCLPSGQAGCVMRIYAQWLHQQPRSVNSFCI